MPNNVSIALRKNSCTVALGVHEPPDLDMLTGSLDKRTWRSPSRSRMHSAQLSLWTNSLWEAPSPWQQILLNIYTPTASSDQDHLLTSLSCTYGSSQFTTTLTRLLLIYVRNSSWDFYQHGHVYVCPPVHTGMHTVDKNRSENSQSALRKVWRY